MAIVPIGFGFAEIDVDTGEYRVRRADAFVGSFQKYDSASSFARAVQQSWLMR